MKEEIIFLFIAFGTIVAIVGLMTTCATTISDNTEKTKRYELCVAKAASTKECSEGNTK